MAEDYGQDTSVAQLIESIAVDAGEVEPPAALRDLILVRARTERQLRRGSSPSPWWILAAVAGLATLGSSAWALSLERSLEKTRTAYETSSDAVVLLSSPDTRSVPLRGAAGLLAVEPRGNAVLVVNSLPRAPEGKTYEAWLIRSGPATAAGFFRGGEPLAVVPLTRAVPPGALVAVSLEPAGGADQPHGPLVFAATQSF